MKLEQLFEAPANDLRNITFYHGTKLTVAANSILKNGLQPGAMKQERGHLAPVAGKVYLTPTLSYAIIYALGMRRAIVSNVCVQSILQ